MVVIAITTLVMGVLCMLLVNIYRTNAYVYEQSSATAQARRSIYNITKDLREASYGSDGSSPIQSAASTSITFLADTNDDQTIERVTYASANGVFSRSVTNAPLDTTTFATSIVNDASTPIFSYFDATGVELTQPIDTTKVTSVIVTLVIKVDANRGPTAFLLSGRATLRNSKNRL